MTLNKIYIGTSLASTVMLVCLMAPAYQAGIQYLSQEWRAAAVALWFVALCWYPIGMWLWGRRK